MQNSTAITFAQLISVKARREQSVRAALHALASREATLRAELAEIAGALADTRMRWKERCEVTNVVDQDALRDLRIELGDYYLAERSLLDRADIGNRQLEEIRMERDKQNEILQKTVIAQDKLKTLLE